jgi:uncharacterized protein YbjT (DUF2867 family)
VVWSTLEDTRPHFERLGSDVPTILGTYKVPHFDAKAEANAFFTELGVPTTFLQTTFFYESFIVGGQGPHRDENGELVLTIPMAGNKMALIAADDIGKTALGVFRRGAEFIGKTVSIAGAHVTGEELAAKFTAVLGEKVVYRPLTHGQVRASGQPGALEIANMYQFYSDASEYFTGVRDLDLVRELNPDLQSLDSWLNEHKTEIPLD